jgi:hypothetical protein
MGKAEGDLRVLPRPRSYSPLPNHQNVSQYSAFLDTEQRRAEEPPGKKKWSEGRRKNVPLWHVPYGYYVPRYRRLLPISTIHRSMRKLTRVRR